MSFSNLVYKDLPYYPYSFLPKDLDALKDGENMKWKEIGSLNHHMEGSFLRTCSSELAQPLQTLAMSKKLNVIYYLLRLLEIGLLQQLALP